MEAQCFREENEALNHSLSVLTRDIHELGVAPLMEQATLATEIPLNVLPLVHLLKQVALKVRETSFDPHEI